MNKNKLSLIFDKRYNDFVVKYPRKCDGNLVINKLLNNEMSYRWNKEEFPNGYELENFVTELDKRGYDIKTLKFSIELKKEV